MCDFQYYFGSEIICQNLKCVNNWMGKWQGYEERIQDCFEILFWSRGIVCQIRINYNKSVFLGDFNKNFIVKKLLYSGIFYLVFLIFNSYLFMVF